MISGYWNHDGDADSEPDDPPDPLLRPVWEAEPDETDFLPPVTERLAAWSAAPVAPRPNSMLAGIDLPALLGPLCDAQDALARLDARTTAAGPTIRDGLIARLAYAEAAGWLAHVQAWVHPLDLALRDLDLTGSYAVAAAGGGARVMPHTYGGGERQAGWDAQPFDAMADADRAVADALALARLLRQLAASKKDRFATAADAEAALSAFGAGALDALRFAQWRAAFAPAPVSPRRFARAGQGRGDKVPALLLAALAAPAWLESGVAIFPTPLQALLTAVGLLARSGATSGIFVPVWAAYPSVGFGERDALPTLRSDMVDRLVGRDRVIGWPVVFLQLVAEGARYGLRELDRLLAVAERAQGLVGKMDRRSRLPDAVDAVLLAPVLTPKALAARLKVAPQTGTALMRALQAAGLVREVTGRGSFRAFAV
jgi:hypothetical protein